MNGTYKKKKNKNKLILEKCLCQWDLQKEEEEEKILIWICMNLCNINLFLSMSEWLWSQLYCVLSYQFNYWLSYLYLKSQARAKASVNKLIANMDCLRIVWEFAFLLHLLCYCLQVVLQINVNSFLYGEPGCDLYCLKIMRMTWPRIVSPHEHLVDLCKDAFSFISLFNYCCQAFSFHCTILCNLQL